MTDRTIGTDSDTLTVLDILQGITGTSHDPDLDLANMLVTVTDATDPEVDHILTELLRDARRD